VSCIQLKCFKSQPCCRYYRVDLPENIGDQCSQIRNISGPSAIPVQQDERFPPYGAIIDPNPTEVDPNAGPIRTLLPQLLSENTGEQPDTMRHKQQTEVFYCHRKPARYVHIRTHADGNHHTICEVQLHINFFSPGRGEHQQSLSIKVFPDDWNMFRG